MSYVSPFANLYNAVLERLKLKAPSLRYVEQDMQQLENYHDRPPVSWPCGLIEIDDIEFSDAGGNCSQIGEGILQIRVGQVAYSPSNGLAAKDIRDAALAYYTIEQEVFAALHGWSAPGFTKLLRRSAKTEPRNDNLRVRILRFDWSFRDTTASPVTIVKATPIPSINDGGATIP